MKINTKVFAILTCLLAGAGLLVYANTVPNEDTILEEHHYVYDKVDRYEGNVEWTYEVIKKRFPVPVLVKMWVDVYWLSNPQFPNDRFVRCWTIDKYFGFIPLKIFGLSFIRLPEGYPVPGPDGRIQGGEKFVKAVYDIYKNRIESWIYEHDYDASMFSNVIMHHKDISYDTFSLFTVYDIHNQHATEKGKETTFEAGDGTFIENVGSHLVSKYNISHDDPIYWDADFVRLWNNYIDVCYRPSGNGYTAYVRFHNRFGKLKNLFKFGSYKDFGVYIDKFSSRYNPKDEIKFFCELVKTADICSSWGDGAYYDDTYHYSSKFKFNQIRMGGILFDDVVRWIYADTGIKDCARRDIESHREHIYRDPKFITDNGVVGFNYDLTVAYNDDPRSEKGDQFDFCLIAQNSNQENDKRTVCGSAYLKDFPKLLDENKCVSKTFLDALWEWGMNRIQNPIEPGTYHNDYSSPQDQGRFTIYYPDPDLIDSTHKPAVSVLYGRSSLNQYLVCPTDYYMREYATHSRYVTKDYRNLMTDVHLSYENTPDGLSNIVPGHQVKCYAYTNNDNPEEQIIYVRKFDPVARHFYDQTLFRICQSKNHFFKNGKTTTEELDRLLKVLLETRQLDEDHKGDFSLYFKVYGTFNFYGVLVDFDDFTGTTRFNFEDGTGPRLVFAP